MRHLNYSDRLPRILTSFTSAIAVSTSSPYQKQSPSSNQRDGATPLRQEYRPLNSITLSKAIAPLHSMRSPSPANAIVKKEFISFPHLEAAEEYDKVQGCGQTERANV
ncbi:MAG: hypothetical protein F6K30_05595 [Cyanothece sp. SIO2G6]|nr:hypothetical protein [Cyanothece sp. SIO2G6]